MLNVSGSGVPGVEQALRGGQRVPVGVAGGDPSVHLLKALQINTESPSSAIGPEIVK